MRASLLVELGLRVLMLNAHVIGAASLTGTLSCLQVTGFLF
jgi:hypothetical protein